MTLCGRCQKLIEAGQDACPGCGAQLNFPEKAYCRICGCRGIDVDTGVCGNCEGVEVARRQDA